MIRESGAAPADDGIEPRRLFLREPGWHVAMKEGSEKSYCFLMAPGQDYHHRLLDGEIYFFRGNERLCTACAERRGLLAHEGKPLRERPETIDLPVVGEPSPFDLKGPAEGESPA